MKTDNNDQLSGPAAAFRPVQAGNTEHVPAGSPEGGQFAPKGNAARPSEGGQWTKVEEQTESRGESQEMARNLTAQYRQTHHVVYFPKAIPRRFAIVDERTFAEKYAGKDWAVKSYTTTYQPKH